MREIKRKGAAISLPSLITLVFCLLVPVFICAESVQDNQLVKTQKSQYIRAPFGFLPSEYICTLTGFDPEDRTVTISPLSNDPEIKSNPLPSSLSICPSYLDASDEWVMEIPLTFNSLKDLGQWTFLCNNGYVAETRGCRNEYNPPCNIICNEEYIETSDPVFFDIDVYNHPPQASISHTPEIIAWNQTVHLLSNAQDPDGGNLTHRWSVLERPPQSTAEFFGTYSSLPGLTLSSPLDIGTWRFQLHVDDDEGERETYTYKLDVPLEISIVGATSIFAKEEAIDLQVTPAPAGNDDDFEINWEVLEKPEAAQMPFATGPNLYFSTTDLDIGIWKFKATASYGGHSDTAEIEVEVKNIVTDITINGESEIFVETPIDLNQTPKNDRDGGELGIIWNVEQCPRSIPPPNQVGHSFFLPTTEDDRGTWIITATATDNETSVTQATFPVEVKNIKPVINLNGTPLVCAGDPTTPINIYTDTFHDVDGGEELDFRWDILQAPQTAPAPKSVQENYLSGPGESFGSIEIETDETFAGVWIFRLTATDGEGESVSEEYTVIVDAPPIADITCDTCDTDSNAIGRQSFPLILNASGSIDPDAPCPQQPDRCHVTLDEIPVSVPLPENTYLWFLMEAPSDWGTYSSGRVDEVFDGVEADKAELTLFSNDLEPGSWTFQLEVTDNEGNGTYTTTTIEVVEENGPPTAIASPPRRYQVDDTGKLTSDITLSGIQSYDLDNILAGDPLEPEVGITSYQWDVLRPPLGCHPPSLESGPGKHTVELYTEGTKVPQTCQGPWQIGLTVTDDDLPTHATDSTSTYLTIGSCLDLVCIHWPSMEMPVHVKLREDTDIFISYQLDPSLNDQPFFGFGAFTLLEIFHESDHANPVYRAFDPNVLDTQKGSFLAFHWDGYSNANERPEQGAYTVRITFVDDLFNFSAHAAVEYDSIWIEVAEPNILPTSDKYVDFKKIESEIGGITLNYQLIGDAEPDELNWHICNTDGSLCHDISEVPGSSRTMVWDGKINGSPAPPGFYTVELEARQENQSMGKSDPYELIVYRLSITPTPSPFYDDQGGLFVFVNRDDDNMNFVSDLADKNPNDFDLAEISITIEPDIGGFYTISSSDITPLFKLWDPDKNETSLPALFSLPEDAVDFKLLIEGLAAGRTELHLEVDTSEGIKLGPGILPMTLVEVQVMKDTNNDQKIGFEDEQIYDVSIARWEAAYDFSFNVLNDPDPKNFVARDPSRFYLRIFDPSANYDPSKIEWIQAKVGTVDGNKSIDDDYTLIELTETAANSGEFISVAQMLTSHDIQTVDDTNADDEFNAHNGTANPVGDDQYGDRTHRAEIEGSLMVEYHPGEALAAMEWEIPVCRREPDEGRKVQLRVHVFNEPYLDVGLDGKPNTGDFGEGNGKFDYTNLAGGTNDHEAGEPSEPYVDLSHSGMNPNSGDAPFVADGRGPVESREKILSQIERTDIAWAQACIKTELLDIIITDAPKVDGVDILLKGFLNDPDLTTIHDTIISPISASTDIVEVIYAAYIPGALGLAFIPEVDPVYEKSYTLLRPNKAVSYRVLAHELGHILTNLDDTWLDRTIFFPNNRGAVKDIDISETRRLARQTVEDSRTVRPAGKPSAVGNRVLKPLF